MLILPHLPHHFGQMLLEFHPQHLLHRRRLLHNNLLSLLPHYFLALMYLLRKHLMLHHQPHHLRCRPIQDWQY